LTNFFHNRGFIRLHPPIITSSDCEGAGEVFKISSDSSLPQTSTEIEPGGNLFFRSPKYLTVSSQLHLEAFVHEHPKVWTLSPTFRAEKSDTPRHLSEFWMLEAELRTESLDDVMDVVQDTIWELVKKLQTSKLLEDLKFVYRKAITGHDKFLESLTPLRERVDSLLRPLWPRITYTEAIKKLQNAAQTKKIRFQYEPTWNNGLQLEHEKYLVLEVGQGCPVFVTHYPRSTKPFYMLPSSNETAHDSVDMDTVACFDLLLPEVCEIAGGSLREDRLDHLVQSMRKQDLNVSATSATARTLDAEPDNLDWYLDLRRYGSVPHGGFGLGFDRLLGYLAGISNIKDVVQWPRYHGRCDC